jgi:hypothetical protein
VLYGALVVLAVVVFNVVHPAWNLWTSTMYGLPDERVIEEN